MKQKEKKEKIDHSLSLALSFFISVSYCFLIVSERTKETEKEIQ